MGAVSGIRSGMIDVEIFFREQGCAPAGAALPGGLFLCLRPREGPAWLASGGPLSLLVQRKRGKKHTREGRRLPSLPGPSPAWRLSPCGGRVAGLSAWCGAGIGLQLPPLRRRLSLPAPLLWVCASISHLRGFQRGPQAPLAAAGGFLRGTLWRKCPP